MCSYFRGFCKISICMWACIFAGPVNSIEFLSPLSDCSQLCPGYVAEGQINVCGYWDFDVVGSFLWWQVKERGLDFGYVVPIDPTNQVGPRLNKHFNYHPGFKVGLGTDVHHDGWEFFLYYTQINTSENSSSGSPSWAIGIEPTWLPNSNNPGDPGPPINTIFGASAHWKSGYNMIDLEMSRPSYIGRSLILSPNFGFRGGWIRQRFTADYVVFGFGTVSSIAKQTAKLIGPRGGCKGTLLLGKGIHIDGGSFLAFLYQDTRARLRREEFTLPSTLATNAKDKERFFVPNLDMTFGIGWGAYFNSRRWFLDCSINYDILYFWDQNWMRHLKDAVDERVDSSPGNIALHGLTTTLKIEF